MLGELYKYQWWVWFKEIEKSRAISYPEVMNLEFLYLIRVPPIFALGVCCLTNVCPAQAYPTFQLLTQTLAVGAAIYSGFGDPCFLLCCPACHFLLNNVSDLPTSKRATKAVAQREQVFPCWDTLQSSCGCCCSAS